MSWCRALLAALLCSTAAAQAPPTEAASAALPPETVSLPASTVPAPSPPEPPLSCAAATSRAMAAELKLAQSSATAVLGQLVQLQELALVYWRLAVTRCDGRARERAERLLQDNEKARAQLAEREHAGAQCEISMRDAAAMQELAKTAFGERRWPEAGSLYRKAETLWDLAAEHCGGAQQQLASRRREEAEIDGHNAESCAPSFEHAREATGRLRALGGGAAPADRERASQVAETGWREALALCRGPALDLARANAEALARDRGTPWVATLAPTQTALAKPARGSGFATVVSATEAARVALVSAPPPVSAAPAVSAKPAPPAAVAGVSAEEEPEEDRSARLLALRPLPELPAGVVELRGVGAVYIGRFVLDAQQRVSGEGRVEWANGDRYEGRMLDGEREGRGRFVWADGQSYEGDWLADFAHGRGLLKYANGDVYEGELVNGRPQGDGEMRYRSGDVFKGSFSGGQPHGRGLYRWANGQSFDGDWNGLVPQGRGRLRFANGNVYEGEVSEGQPEGRGRLQYGNGGVYEGSFKSGIAQGQGKYIWPGGDRYEGAWVAGKKHGQGTFFFASGERWVGRFEDDERTDDGVFHGK